MVNSGAKKEFLVTSNSNKPLVRAMGANGLLIMLIAFVLLVHFAFVEYRASPIIEYILVAGGVVFYGKMYFSYIARLLIVDDELIAIRSLDEVSYSRQMIEYVDLRRSKAFGIIKVRVKMVDRRGPRVLRSMCPIGSENLTIVEETWLSPLLRAKNVKT